MYHRIQSRILFPGLASTALVSSALPSCGEANCLETKTCTTTPSSTGGSGSFGAGGLNFATNPNKGEAGAAGGGPTGSGGEATIGNGGEAGGDSGEPCSDEGERRCAAAAASAILECNGGVWVAAKTCARGELCDSTRADCATIAPGCERLAPGGSFCEDNELVVCGPDLVTVEREVCEGDCARGACVDDGSGGAASGGGGGGSSNTNGGSNDAGGAAGSASTESGTGSGNEAGAPVSNPCSPSPCPADRVCVNDDPGFHCACPPGTIGASCTPVVEHLGTPPGRPRCNVHGTNVDGSVVIGECGEGVSFRDAFRWTAGGGFQLLDDSQKSTSAYDVSADGTIVIGNAIAQTGEEFSFRWTAANGMTEDTENPLYISDDASAWIVGSTRRTSSTNQSLGFKALQISSNGEVVVGYKTEGAGTKAYKWTIGGSTVELPPPSGMTNAVAKCASKDGSVIGGKAEMGGQIYGVIWRGTTPESVGVTAEVHGVTAAGIQILTDDGSAGLSFFGYADRALYWSESGGLRPLYKALNEGGAVLGERDLYVVEGLSGDGRFVVGTLESEFIFRARLPD